MGKNIEYLLPQDVLFDSSLKPNEKLIYAILKAETSEQGSTNISNSQISKALGINKATVISSITGLESKGYIARELLRNGDGTINKRNITLLK